MLSREDNELLCRVGSGTPVGAMLRQYWVPALMSSELPERDGAPVRVRLMGENLIAFRVTSGKIGLIQNHCPHRGASLFFGRNEEEGLRCVYPGWKYDCEGACVDMPNEPPESNLKSKIRATAYPCVARNDIIWTYMGPRQTPPPLPDIEPNMLPQGEYAVQKVLRECNWFQGLEGDIDTSHLGFLHLGAVKPEQTTPGTFDYYNVADRAPKYEVVDTEFGTSYGAYRPAEADSYYWRIAHYLFPFFTMIPTGILGMQILVRAWVPVDDNHVMFWSIAAPRSRVGNGAAGGCSTPLGRCATARRRRRASTIRRSPAIAPAVSSCRAPPTGSRPGRGCARRSRRPRPKRPSRHDARRRTGRPENGRRDLRAHQGPEGRHGHGTGHPLRAHRGEPDRRRVPAHGAHARVRRVRDGDHDLSDRQGPRQAVHGAADLRHAPVPSRADRVQREVGGDVAEGSRGQEGGGPCLHRHDGRLGARHSGDRVRRRPRQGHLGRRRRGARSGAPQALEGAGASGRESRSD